MNLKRFFKRTSDPSDIGVGDECTPNIDEDNNVTNREPLVSEKPNDGTNVSLALNVLDKLNKNANGGNILFSPLGLCTPLEILLYGATPKSQAKENIKKLLGGFRMQNFKEPVLGGLEFDHSNRVVFDPTRIQLKKSFIDKLSSAFGISVSNVDFNSIEQTIKDINKWVNEHIQGEEKQINLKYSSITGLEIVDVLSLDARWKLPFDAASTHDSTFYNLDGTKSPIKMMCYGLISASFQHKAISYQGTDDYQVVELKYCGDEVSMIVVLPREGKALDEIMLDRKWLNVSPEKYDELKLFLPKFKFETSINLNGILSDLGLDDLFYTNGALSEISDMPLFVQKAKQDCTIKVYEKGTMATAITHFDLAGCAPYTNNIIMVVDCPFGFAIKGSDGNILFMGVVNNLDEKMTNTEIDRIPNPQEDNKVIRIPKYIKRPVPAKIKQRLTSTSVLGTVGIRNLEIYEQLLDEDPQLSLQHKTDDKNDPNTVEVYYGDEKMGYIPKSKNEILANLLDAEIPLRAIVTKAGWVDGEYQIKVDIAIVEL